MGGAGASGGGSSGIYNNPPPTLSSSSSMLRLAPGGGRIPTTANMLISTLAHESEDSFLARLEALRRPPPHPDSPAAAGAGPRPASLSGGSGSSGVFTRPPSLFGSRPPPFSAFSSTSRLPLAQHSIVSSSEGGGGPFVDFASPRPDSGIVTGTNEEAFQTFNSPFFSADRGSKPSSRGVRDTAVVSG